jgi:uncharacterized protein
VRFTVDTWAPEYGTAEDHGLADADVDVDSSIEVSPAAWLPKQPDDCPMPQRLVFLDGVRRIDARVWISGSESVSPGICATYAAGTVIVEDGRAFVARAEVERGLFTKAGTAQAIDTAHARYDVRLVSDDSPEGLAQAVQDRMLTLEAGLASETEGDLIVVDGPLRTPHPEGLAVGYIKTHRIAYLPDELMSVVEQLESGQRSPLFLIGSANGGRFTRLSWYVRLPGPRHHPLAGVVRCEQHADQPLNEAVQRCDVVTSLLPGFASEPHKDPRAPQNLYPVAGLERDLRRRLGDQWLLERNLRRAAS